MVKLEMPQIFKALLWALLAAIGLSAPHAYATVNVSPETSSVLAPSTQVHHFKAAIVQSGEYPEFDDLMRYLLRHLVEEGLMAPVVGLNRDNFSYSLPQDYAALVKAQRVTSLIHSTQKTSAQSESASLEFVPDGLYDLKWRADTQAEVLAALKPRIESGEINFIIALGTNAGLLVTQNDFNIPIVVIDATDPERNGVAAIGEFSNHPNVFVQKMRSRFTTQLLLFSELFNFKRMGILIDQDPNNQVAQAIAAIEVLAQKAGFELVPCYGHFMSAEESHLERDFAKCLTELSQADIDAMFLTIGYRPKTPLIDYLKPFIDRGIPVYSQSGADDVRRGALMSLAEPKMQASGIFMADVIRQIANGTPPDRISQYFSPSVHMVFNLEVARLIQWQPSFEVLLAIDQVFTTISD